MRKIGVVGGTGIENPDTLKVLKVKFWKLLMGKPSVRLAK